MFSYLISFLLNIGMLILAPNFLENGKYFNRPMFSMSSTWLERALSSITTIYLLMLCYCTWVYYNLLMEIIFGAR